MCSSSSNNNVGLIALTFKSFCYSKNLFICQFMFLFTLTGCRLNNCLFFSLLFCFQSCKILIWVKRYLKRSERLQGYHDDDNMLRVTADCCKKTQKHNFWKKYPGIIKVILCSPYTAGSLGATVLDSVVTGPQIDMDTACIHVWEYVANVLVITFHLELCSSCVDQFNYMYMFTSMTSKTNC